ncbi:imidazole glycerol phosphate synthase subunit HisH [Isachenkonia alkalipeptolytica]|uniref:Imidazole glycerol phosphate synthase subunit HisH n=1 Tax=Isachenkonia alkalipeptolytica TaxID=2565777 RepID=A0AA43XJL5_9CLOT|nr:imidazole glycerol phosphate synthase subunit HisH [Isachenkonia alkalipeptolytica]NBG87514.1 imidazole glycerol phosphate synthase subunit HisH [Isachenkonia alkalipeptolytica]
MIAIIDYDVGNIKSVCNALDKIGLPWTLTRDPETIKASKGIILPGVGAFEDAMQSLIDHQLVSLLQEEIRREKPFLGICLGMQLLYERSFENGEFEGLGVLKGEVVPFRTKLKVPHMGWNALALNDGHRDHPILKHTKNEDYVYFVHSYYVQGLAEETIAYCTYDQRFSALVDRGNLLGMQFHPEKSGDAGLQLLKSFKEMIQ